MITLTIAQSEWPEGAQHAYETIQRRRSVALFVRKLRRPKYDLVSSSEFFYAIEFHKKIEGWVHWHLCVRPKGHWPNDPEKSDPDYQQLKYAYNKFNDGLSKIWGHGFVTASNEGQEPEHAMNYLTKYISKQDTPAPEWVLDYGGNFRKFSTSRGLCSISRKRSESETTEAKRRRTPREVVAQCKKDSKLLHTFKVTYRKQIDGEDDPDVPPKVKKKFRFAGSLPASIDELKTEDSDVTRDVLNRSISAKEARRRLAERGHKANLALEDNGARGCS